MCVHTCVCQEHERGNPPHLLLIALSTWRYPSPLVPLQVIFSERITAFVCMIVGVIVFGYVVGQVRDTQRVASPDRPMVMFYRHGTYPEYTSCLIFV